MTGRIDIDDLDRLYAKATAPPWDIEDIFCALPEGQESGNSPKLWSVPLRTSIDLDRDPMSLAKAEVSCSDPSLRWQDAELVVALVNAYPALAKRIRELEKREAALVEHLDWMSVSAAEIAKMKEPTP